MDKKLKARIIQALRKFTYTYKPRANAMNKMKVAPATFECELCGVWMYKGTSQKNFDQMKIDFPNESILMEVPKMDHIEPIIDPVKGWQGWDTYIERMFCEEEMFQCICHKCHKEKTNKETEIRKQHRKKKEK